MRNREIKEKKHLNFFKYIKLFKDIVLSSLSNIILITTLQFLIYPHLGRSLDQNAFGTFLFLIAISNITGVSSGNTLNNLYLRNFAADSRISLGKEFNAKFLLMTMISFITTTIACVTVTNVTTAFLFGVLSVLISSRSFFSVEFRVKLDYGSYLVMNIILVIGYIVGVLIFKNYPVLAFISAESLCLVYILFKSNLWKEIPRFHPFFSLVLRDYVLLLISSLSVSLFTYADRFLIYPILGSENVGVYYAASTIGKIIGMATGPLTGVVLSYLTHIDEQKMKIYLSRLTKLSLGFVFIVFILVESSSAFLIRFLYPDYYDKALQIHLILNIGYALKTIESFYRPLMIRYVNLSFLTKIDIGFGMVYLIFGLIGSLYFGLAGLSYAFLLTSSLKAFTQISMCNKHFRKISNVGSVLRKREKVNDDFEV